MYNLNTEHMWKKKLFVLFVVYWPCFHLTTKYVWSGLCAGDDCKKQNTYKIRVHSKFIYFKNHINIKISKSSIKEIDPVAGLIFLQVTHRCRALMNSAVDFRVPYTTLTRPGCLRGTTVEHGYPTRGLPTCVMRPTDIFGNYILEKLHNNLDC